MSDSPRLALCLEQTLGHRAHGLNIESALAASGGECSVIRVEFPAPSRSRTPWALHGSLDARRQLRRLPRRADVALFHTSTISLAAPQSPARRYVVSIDATPAQVDGMGRWYRHRRAPAPLEAMKRQLYRRVFREAAAVVAWSTWAADSLVDDYAVDRSRITVVQPGAPRAFFGIPRPAPARRPTILFVGGDFERKGGDLLLEAFRPLAARADLVLVTEAAVPDAPGVRVEHGVRPGTQRLTHAFSAADIFCLPTRGDCTSVAIEEAMASGLPVITTPVGSNSGTVRDGVTGMLVPVDDLAALHDALRRLIDDRPLRVGMGLAGRDAAYMEMDAEANALAVLSLLREVA